MPIFEGILSFITLISVFCFTYGVAVLPDSENERWVALKVSNVAQWLDSANEIIGLGESYEKVENPAKFVDAWLSVQPFKKEGEYYFRLTGYLFDGNIFHRNLRLREKLLIANELKPEHVAYLADNEKQKLEGVLRYIVGLDLKGKDLRYADFSMSLMPKVDFREDKDGVPARLSGAKFQGAKLFKARMNGAHLNRAQFQEADLEGAQLQSAHLRYTQFQGADLNAVQFQGASLAYAQLQLANLRDAQLQNADLTNAYLQLASLNAAQLKLANLRGTRLQGADLADAQLQGANLRGATLGCRNIAFKL